MSYVRSEPTSPAAVYLRVEAASLLSVLSMCMVVQWGLERGEAPVWEQPGAEQACNPGRKAGEKLRQRRQLGSSPEHTGRIYSRQQLMARIYPDERIVSDRTIDSHLQKLRRKIVEVSPEKELIHSVYGVGYKCEVV